MAKNKWWHKSDQMLAVLLKERTPAVKSKSPVFVTNARLCRWRPCIKFQIEILLVMACFFIFARPERGEKFGKVIVGETSKKGRRRRGKKGTRKGGSTRSYRGAKGEEERVVGCFYFFNNFSLVPHCHWLGVSGGHRKNLWKDRKHK